MATPEKKAKAAFLAALEKTAAEYGWTLDLESHAGESYSTPTLDITGSLYHPLRYGWGVPIAIELKRFDGKGKLTGRQRMTMRKKAAAGVAVFLIASPADIESFVEWIKHGCKPQPYIEAS